MLCTESRTVLEESCIMLQQKLEERVISSSSGQLSVHTTLICEAQVPFEFAD